VVVSIGGGRSGADRGAFCELTPCLPGPVTRHKLAANRKVGAITCKKGQDIGVDTKQRVQYCTTARPARVDGVPVAANAYTLFHPSGRIYQTHARTPFRRALADGSTVICGADLVALGDDGSLRYCKLAGALASTRGRPRPRVGEGITFYPDGRVAGMTLDEPYTAGRLALPAGTSVAWDDKGTVLGGYLQSELSTRGISIKYEFELHPNGALAHATLAAPATIAKHPFPSFGELWFRDDGTLARAQYVSDRGFMIHGEPWTDTRFESFDRSGKLTSTRTEHHQSTQRPPKFRP